MDFGFINDKVAERIVESPHLQIFLQNRIMKYPAAQRYFLEYHPLRDYACTPYINYFTEYLKYKNTNEAILFAHGFMYISALMSKNNNNLSKHFNKIRQTELTSEVYHIPAARKYGVQMIHQWVNKNFSAYEKELETALNLRNNYSIAAESSACSYDYMLIEHLLLIERYEEITEIDKTTIHQKYNDFTPASRQLSHKIRFKIT